MLSVLLHAAHGQVRQDDGQDKIWSSATVDTLWEKDSGVWLYKPNEEACERGLRVNVLALGAVAEFGAQNCQYTTKVDAR